MRKINILFFILFAGYFCGYSAGRENYIRCYNIIDSMLDGTKDTSFKKAVYEVENAWYDGKLDETEFYSVIRNYALLCTEKGKMMDIRYDFDDIRSFRNHASLFSFMTDTTLIYIDDTTFVSHPPFIYGEENIMENKDWGRTSVTSLLVTHRGNCRSLPILYKLIAGEMGVKAWLALAPNHLYIKLHNKTNGWYNTELTSGVFPTDAWLMASGYIHTDAVKNEMYLDTLSLQESIALCLTDLADSYLHKFPETGYDDFVLWCCDKALEYFPHYINALLIKAEGLRFRYEHNAEKPESLRKEIDKLYAHIHKLGYRKMPEKMYREWLLSLKTKNKPENEDEHLPH
ncbi:delta-60 repeat domain-containing protein [Barnesiella propionica]|uniref:delta-60 repeat domain-containing protein n=1 Tax=Barnesiella propionica TaxID=2981781 RepID=UPI0011CCA4EF|nr:delta-60 repeat domain-containing protein [Barnesiella propionica]MCU6769144.1 delta-60 repeat domain-containing protein [Barnesiella propionica]